MLVAPSLLLCVLPCANSPSKSGQIARVDMRISEGQESGRRYTNYPTPSYVHGDQMLYISIHYLTLYEEQGKEKESEKKGLASVPLDQPDQIWISSPQVFQ